jgi:hypothetical protein
MLAVRALLFLDSPPNLTERQTFAMRPLLPWSGDRRVLQPVEQVDRLAVCGSGRDRYGPLGRERNDRPRSPVGPSRPGCHPPVTATMSVAGGLWSMDVQVFASSVRISSRGLSGARGIRPRPAGSAKRSAALWK